jgi:hypothetical protein
MRISMQKLGVCVSLCLVAGLQLSLYLFGMRLANGDNAILIRAIVPRCAQMGT